MVQEGVEMCSPEVMAAVRRQIAAGGGRIDRRRLLAGGAAAVAAGAIAPVLASAQHATPVETPGATPAAGPSTIYSTSVPITRVYDLTHVMGPDFPMFYGAEPMQIEQIKSIAADGFYKNRLTLDEHTGTHMDAPAHFIEDGATADQLDPRAFFAPLCVIDISAKAASDPDAVVTDGDIAEWEAVNGTIPDRAFVAMSSGWDAKANDPEAYINLDASNVQHFPGWSGQAVAFLTGERTVVGIGTDTASLDPGNSTSFQAHINALGAGLYGIENLANLGSVPAVGTTVIVGWPKHFHASGGPARVMAIEFAP
jgi:kynurenine formamidase